jgi:hypothetical protein
MVPTLWWYQLCDGTTPVKAPMALLGYALEAPLCLRHLVLGKDEQEEAKR